MEFFTKFVLHNPTSPFGRNSGESANFSTTQWNHPPLIGSFLPAARHLFPFRFQKSKVLSLKKVGLKVQKKSFKKYYKTAHP